MPFEIIDVKAIIEEELKQDEFKTSFESLRREYDLVDQIIRIRKNLRITQSQLAGLSNVSIRTISRLEKENHIPKFDTFLKIIDGLGMKFIMTKR